MRAADALRPLRILLGLLPLAAAAQVLPPLVQADGSLHAGWRFVGIPKQHADLPPTRFDPGVVNGQAAVQVVTAASLARIESPNWIRAASSEDRRNST
jgi:hypothetical protein